VTCGLVSQVFTRIIDFTNLRDEPMWRPSDPLFHLVLVYTVGLCASLHAGQRTWRLVEVASRTAYSLGQAACPLGRAACPLVPAASQGRGRLAGLYLGRAASRTTPLRRARRDNQNGVLIHSIRSPDAKVMAFTRLTCFSAHPW